ncbi:MAG TPA: UvrD-helicase domain-containing protein [Terracidiphilus sp.]|nr:UvrD-helicase domain-containing protein [Terracidiphilus sp.]
MRTILSNLNPEQRAAVEATEGPLLILAGAGSGKTRVITSRIAWLIEEKGVAPDAILAVTFTNKAANEMGERVDRLLGHGSLAKPLIATFHSLCVRILRRDIEALRIGDKGLTRNFAIFDENDQQGIVKQIMKRMGLDTKQLTPRTVLGRISWAKNHMVDPQEYFLNSKDPNSERIAQIYKQYQTELAKNNAMDFDDLLLEAVRLLKASREVKERYQRRYRYLLVDEYQDTNRPQYELMKLLASEEKNVCAVGDEDQSIYSWRGADIRNILEFEQDFPNARIVRLEQNYRSTQVILEAAGAVVANNIRRKGKKLWTERQGGSLIGYYEAPDGENEALFIADKIQAFMRENREADEGSGGGMHCAVLYRTNSQSRLVEEALRRYNISYTMVGGFSFYERAEIKDLLAYLRLVRNPHDSMALERVVNTPARGIGKTTLETVERLALETGKSTWDASAAAIENRLIPARALAALDSFRQLITDAQAMMDPDFAGELSADVADSEDADTGFGFGAGASKVTESDALDTDFNVGGNDDQLLLLDPASFSPFVQSSHSFLTMPKAANIPASRVYEAAPIPEHSMVEVSVDGKTRQVSEVAYEKLKIRLETLSERAERIGVSGPRTSVNSQSPMKVAIFFDPMRAGKWELIGVVSKREGKLVTDQVGAETVPNAYLDDPEKCEHCNTRRHRNETYILKNDDGGYKQVGSSCLHEFLGDKPEVRRLRNPDAWRFHSDSVKELDLYLDELVARDAEVLRVAYSYVEEAPALGAPPLIPIEEPAAFRAPGDPATLPELIRFIIDRTGYIKALETEGSPEAFSRIENLKELANAAHDAEARGETLGDFLDHAALASDTDQFDPDARVTLMTLHAAKGLEFPLVFLAGLEEGLFPHSRTLNSPEELEEERRLCYVGMTRAMNTLILTRAHYRRRYGNDSPEMSVPSRFLEEVPPALIENLGGGSPAWSTPAYGHASRRGFGRGDRRDWARDGDSRHYNYEDESQEIHPAASAQNAASRRDPSKPFVAPWMTGAKKSGLAGQESSPKSESAAAQSGPDAHSIDNIAKFFGGKSGAGRPGSLPRPALEIATPSGATGLKKGDRVRHAKYGEGVVMMREGDGEDAKLTVVFERHGLKKLMEKFANLRKTY